MGEINDYIENTIIEKLWKPLPKLVKCFIVVILILVFIFRYIPSLFPIYDKWVDIKNRFDCNKQVPSETTIYVDSIPQDTIKQDSIQPPMIIVDTFRPQKAKTEQIIGEGTIEDFTEKEAQKQALEEAKIDLFSKFPKDKEQIVNRYCKIITNTTERTNAGMWKAHIVISINESQLK